MACCPDLTILKWSFRPASMVIVGIHYSNMINLCRVVVLYKSAEVNQRYQCHGGWWAKRSVVSNTIRCIWEARFVLLTSASGWFFFLILFFKFSTSCTVHGTWTVQSGICTVILKWIVNFFFFRFQFSIFSKISDIQMHTMSEVYVSV